MKKIIIFFAAVSLFAYASVFAEDSGGSGNEYYKKAEEALSAYSEGDVGLAEELSQESLALRENDKAYLVLSMSAKKKGDFKAAESYIQKAIKIEPSNPAYYFIVSELRIADGDIDGSLEYAKKTLEISPVNALALQLVMGIAQNLSERGEFDKALGAVDFIELKIRAGSEYVSWAKYFRGEIMTRRQKYDEALAYLTELTGIDLGPKYNSMVYELIGSISIEKKNWDGAIQASLKALDINPKSYLAKNDLAVAYAMKNEYEKALSYMKSAFLENKTFSPVLQNIAYFSNMLLQKKQYALAKDLIMTVMVNSTDKNYILGAREELVRIYFMEKKYDEAIAELNGILKDYKGHEDLPFVYDKLSLIYYAKRDFVNAQRYSILAGKKYYLLILLGNTVSGLFMLTFIFLFVYGLAKLYRKLMRLPGVETRVFRFLDFYGIIILPNFFYPAIVVLSSIVLYGAFIPDPSKDLVIHNILNLSLLNAVMAGFAVWFVFKVYKLTKSEAGFAMPVRPVVMDFILLLVAVFCFNGAYDFIFAKLLNLSLPASAFTDILKSETNPILLLIEKSAGILLIPVAEEIVYRGFVYPVLKQQTGVKAGIVLSSVFFALMHLDLFPLGFLPIFVMGTALAFLRERSGSLLPPVLFHITYNLLAFIIPQA